MFRRGKHTAVLAGVSIRGDIRSRGTLIIQGEVEGDIEHQGELVVGAGARCLSHIRASALTVAGEIRGSVRVDGTLQILPGGQVYGPVTCGKLVVQAGGILHGTVNTDGTAPEQAASHPDGGTPVPVSPPAVAAAAATAMVAPAAAPPVPPAAPVPAAPAAAFAATALPAPVPPPGGPPGPAIELASIAFEGSLPTAPPAGMLRTLVR